MSQYNKREQATGYNPDCHHRPVIHTHTFVIPSITCLKNGSIHVQAHKDQEDSDRHF
jgi:hypothetical protein